MAWLISLRGEGASSRRASTATPQAIHRLLRKRKIGETMVTDTRVPMRRYRVILGNVWWKFVFVVDVDACEVVFFDAEKKDEETHKRLRRRL
ncbi:MAG TPA: hypothetical protein EYP08_07285 [Pyrodictiaceae archaeon]|nr:hypothetical protein [Pyrodictiaceae archaeon]